MLRITVNGPAGPRCSVEAPLDWTFQQVQEAIFEKIGVAAARQILLHGTSELQPQALVSSITDAPAPSGVALTLIEDPVTQAEMFAAFEAATLSHRADDKGAAALGRLCGLVERCRSKTLNARFPRGHFGGLTLLQAAAFLGDQYDHLQAFGCALLQRPDYTLVNDKPGCGTTTAAGTIHFPGLEDGTALHLAALGGKVALCRAIIDRDDFVELDARWSGSREACSNGWAMVDLPPGETAAEVALRCGHREIHEMLVAAQASKSSATAGG